MTATILSWILCGVVVLFILIGFFWGLKRGLKRTAIRGAWLIVTIIIVALLSGLISKAIINSDILSWFNVTIDGVKVNNITELVQVYVSDLGISPENVKEVVSLVVALVVLALNAIIFTVLFWLTKILFTPFYYLLCRLVLKDRKKEKQTITTKSGKQKVVKKHIKVKKHRLLGGLVGVFVGAVVCVATLTPVVGYLNIVKSVEEESKEQRGEGLVSSMVGADTYALLEGGVYSGAFNGVYTYTGMKFLSQATFNTLTSATINGQSVSLNDEGKQVIKIYGEIEDMEMVDLNTCTKAELDTFLNKVNSLIITAFDSDIVSSASEVIVDVATDILKTKVNIEDLPVYSQDLVSAVIANVGELNSNSIKTELQKIVTFAKSLNNTNILLPMIQGETDDILTLLQENLTEDNTRAVVNSLFDLQIINDIAPHVANTILGFVADNIGAEYNEIGTLENETLKNSLINITTSAVGALRNIDTESQFYVKLEGISAIGRFVNEVVNSPLVDEDFETQLVDMVQDEAREKINEMESEAYLKNFILGIINNLDLVSNYESEFTHIQNFATYAEEALNEQDVENLDLKQVDFTKLGKGLDEIEKSVLVNNSNENLINTLVINVLEDLETSEDFETYDLTSVDEIKQNINANKDIVWENDLTAIGEFIIEAKEYLDQMESEGVAGSDGLASLGAQLDSLKTTQVVGNNGVNALVKDLLTMSTDGFGDEGFEAVYKDAINTVVDNVDIAKQYSWTNEFNHIANLMEDDYEDVTIDDLPAFGEKFDNIINGYQDGEDFVNKSEIVDKKVIDICITSVFDDTFTVEGDVQFDVESIKNAFTDNDTTDSKYTNNITSYKSEFEVFSKLYQLSGYDFTVSSDAQDMGKQIDEVIALNSAIITREYINDYMKDVIKDKLPSEIDPQFRSIVDNIVGSDNGTPDDTSDDVISRLDTMTSTYESEFVALNKIYGIINNQSAIAIENINQVTTYPGEATGKTIGARLDEIKDSELVGDAGKIVLLSALETYQADSDNASYADIIDEIIVNVENMDLESTTPYTTTFNEISTFNNEIAEIKAKVEGIQLNSTTATYLDGKMAELQELNIINYNATAEIVIYAMSEVDKTFAALPQTPQIENARSYITAYTTLYLPNITADVPYDSDTETLVELAGTDFPVNKPFTQIINLMNISV